MVIIGARQHFQSFEFRQRKRKKGGRERERDRERREREKRERERESARMLEWVLMCADAVVDESISLRLSKHSFGTESCGLTGAAAVEEEEDSDDGKRERERERETETERGIPQCVFLCFL